MKQDWLLVYLFIHSFVYSFYSYIVLFLFEIPLLEKGVTGFSCFNLTFLRFYVHVFLRINSIFKFYLTLPFHFQVQFKSSLDNPSSAKALSVPCGLRSIQDIVVIYIYLFCLFISIISRVGGQENRWWGRVKWMNSLGFASFFPSDYKLFPFEISKQKEGKQGRTRQTKSYSIEIHPQYSPGELQFRRSNDH